MEKFWLDWMFMVREPVMPFRKEISLQTSARRVGTVRDAHDGHPVAAAQLQILVPAFQGEGVAGSAVTGSDGGFRLSEPAGARTEGARLRVTAPQHSALMRHLPPPGHVVVSLVTRRRALVERLVSWARSRGAPWAGALEPTPGAIAGLARERDHVVVERWARAIEDAAFGPAPPDEPRERALHEAEPARAGDENDR
jgi:hypothetical protein